MLLSIVPVLLTFFVVLLATGPARATVPEADLNGRVLQELYGGVIANQTITVVGQDFFQYFTALWRDQPMNEQFALSVHERPSARWGSQVWVEFAQRRVFQAFLPPARANIRGVAERAVQQAYQNVVEAQVQRALFREPDLGPDEM